MSNNPYREPPTTGPTRKSAHYWARLRQHTVPLIGWRLAVLAVFGLLTCAAVQCDGRIDTTNDDLCRSACEALGARYYIAPDPPHRCMCTRAGDLGWSPSSGGQRHEHDD